MITNPFNFESLVWDWPITVYLFLVGISAGMVIVSVLLKRCVLANDVAIKDNSMFKVMAIIAPITVVSGLFILIFHLSKPFSFWKILVFYSPVSVMSLGVILFQIYMVFLFIWLMILYQEEIDRFLQKLLPTGKIPHGVIRLFNGIINFFKPYQNTFEWVSFICALMLGAYTGFLLSALKSYPLLNNPVLPVLFMFSGVSSGAAMCVVAALLWTKEKTDSANIHFIHRLETPVVVFELFLLFAFFMGSYFAGGQKVVAVINAIGGGFWSNVFWFGVIGLGILVPLIANWVVPEAVKSRRVYLLMMGALTLAGVFMLRHFILYAGQMTLV